MTARSASHRHGKWLWALTGLFALRVAAQPAALGVRHRLLPPFESWHSDTVPYGLLLASQLVILVAMAERSWKVTRRAQRAQPTAGRVASWLGGVYFASMLARLILGVTLLADSRWFASWLPTLFHLGLAAFLLVLGDYHRRSAANLAAGRNERYGPTTA